MKWFSGRGLYAAAILALMALPIHVTQADSLVTTAGEFLIGEVRKTDTGYSVQTKTQLVQVKAQDVRTILWDHHPTTNEDGGTLPNTPRAPVKPADPKIVNALMEQGRAAVAAGEYVDARNAFEDAFTLDPKNPHAGRELGFAYLKLGKPEKAAQPLRVAAEGLPMDRSLTMGLAASLVTTHDPMGAAKCLETYLQSHTDFVDEPVLNALGIALWQADPSAMHTPVFTDGVKMYSTFNAELETTKPGQRRWGTEWLPADDVTERQKARHLAQAKVDETYSTLQDINDQLKAPQASLDAATKLSPKLHSDRDKQIHDAQTQIDAIKPKQEAAQSDYDAADAELAKLPGPVFPSVIALTDADLAPAANSTVASGKRVTRHAAAFAIAPDVVVTAADPLDGATDIQITTSEGKTMTATVLRMHHGDGLALLEVTGAKLPCLRLATEEKSGALICMGYPEVEPHAPVAKPMQVSSAEPQGPWTVKFAISPRIPGAPLLRNGLVVGVELGDRDSDLAAVPAATLKELLSLVESEAQPLQIAGDAKRGVMQVAAQH